MAKIRRALDMIKGVKPTKKEIAKGEKALDAWNSKMASDLAEEEIEKSLAQTLGGAINKGVKKTATLDVPGGRGIKKGVAHAIADPTAIKKEIQDTTGEALTGTKRTDTSEIIVKDPDVVIADMSQSLKQGSKDISQNFKDSFDKLDMDLGFKGNKKTTDRLRARWVRINKDHGVDVTKKSANPLMKDFEVIIGKMESGQMSMSRGLRKLRAKAGQAEHNNKSGIGKNVDQRLAGSDDFLAKFNKDVRNDFNNHASRVGISRKDSEFMNEVARVDKAYTDHFSIKNNKKIQRAQVRDSDGKAYINDILNDADNSPNKLKEFLDDMEQMGKDMGDPTFASKQKELMREIVKTKLLSSNDASLNMFGKYMTSNSGVKTLKKLWPEMADELDGFGKMFKDTKEIHGQITQWGAKVIGISLATGAGTLFGGIGGGVVAATAAMSILRAAKSPAFNRFVLRQFSNKPMPQGKAREWLSNFIEKQGSKLGVNASAEDILASMTGWTTLGGGAAIGGYSAGKEVVDRRVDADFEKAKLGNKTQQQLDSEFEKALNSQ